ncbi:ROK family glucokinase [Nocardioides terrisoli]|uniref:ROK family glucokinase n=1 Tax=Nocardioides terrisoli TaxID=3388267 RepID=UPI00287BA078|nr:ROK family glucokinase [Nocardioides marmorisolisilvae]
MATHGTQHLSIGVDVGGTKIAGGLVSEDGTLLGSARRESPATDSSAIVATIADLVEELTATAEGAVRGIGVAAAGFVDRDRSTVLFAPNLAWRDEPLRADLETRLKLPVVIENDANAAAWGEFRFGAGADVDDLLLITVGTGIGGGVVLDGQLMRGGFGIGAEVGHMRVVPDGRLCGCGNHGCWEPYGSGNALVKNTRTEAAQSLLASDLVARAGGDPDDIDGPMISAAAAAGDQFAIDQIKEIGTWLGAGIASLAAILDPTVVVIGGGVSEAGELLVGPVRETFGRLLTGRGHRPTAEIRLASLGNRAGMLGVADLARTPAR